MKGAVAAGHPLTAEAGARVLAGGGNAVDACVAAAFVSWVTESCLTGPGAGGFMLVYRARDRSVRVLDFFVAVPGRGAPGSPAPMDAVDVAFEPRNLQRFLVGGSSCAVPGTPAGLAEAHRLYGRRPWRDLVAPAAELARAGVELTPAQAQLHAILEPILRRTAEGQQIYGPPGRTPRAGDRIVMRDLAGTLDAIGEDGAAVLYRGELARKLAGAVRVAGGRVTEEDLASYRVIRRAPVRTAIRGHEFVSNPPPSSGGLLIAFALGLLERQPSLHEQGSAAAYALLAEVMRQAALARDGRFASDLYRGGLARRLLDRSVVETAAARVANGDASVPREPVALPSTTHISVVDAKGNVASLSSSTGAGSGVVVPGTGIHVNNMFGEEEIAARGFPKRAGERLTSMMAPSLVLRDGRPALVLGSAGSGRLRAAILQIVANSVHRGLGVAEAIAAPRIHLDGARLHLEGGIPDSVARELRARGYDTVRWRSLNPFFGGASAVSLGPRGELEAAGDPRRGGAGIVIA
jgi:gamma-glutamyltranspeptidase / glutathione hydrolase